MNAHISDVDPMNIVQKAFRENAQKVQEVSMIAGAKAICTVVLEMAEAQGKTAEEKLDDIVKFCRTNKENADKSV